MDDERSRSALPGRFFIFIGPATVIGHRPATKFAFQALGAEIRIIHQYDYSLAFDIDASIVVPAALGSVDTIADKHDVAVGHCDFRLFLITCRDIVAAIVE